MKADVLFVPAIGNNSMCFGETCVSVDHSLQARDVKRKITEYKRILGTMVGSGGWGKWEMPSFDFSTWMYGVGIVAFGMVTPSSLRGPLVIVGLATIVVGRVMGDEWGCTADLDRMRVNCGRGIFATDETDIGGYGAMVQNETLIGKYMLRRANLTVGTCFACMSLMQCVAMERLVDLAVSWGPAYGLETYKDYAQSPPIFDWSETVYVDVSTDGEEFTWLKSLVHSRTADKFKPKFVRTYDRKVNITLIHSGQKKPQCNEVLHMGLEPVRWYRSLYPTLVYRMAKVTSNLCQNSTLVSASRGGFTIHSDEAQWLKTNATQIVEMRIVQLRGCLWPEEQLVGGMQKGFMRNRAGLASPRGSVIPGYTRPGNEFWNRVPFTMQLAWCPGTNVTVDPECVKRTSMMSEGPNGLIKQWCPECMMYVVPCACKYAG